MVSNEAPHFRVRRRRELPEEHQALQLVRDRDRRSRENDGLLPRISAMKPIAAATVCVFAFGSSPSRASPPVDDHVQRAKSVPAASRR